MKDWDYITTAAPDGMVPPPSRLDIGSLMAIKDKLQAERRTLTTDFVCTEEVLEAIKKMLDPAKSVSEVPLPHMYGIPVYTSKTVFGVIAKMIELILAGRRPACLPEELKDKIYKLMGRDAFLNATLETDPATQWSVTDR